MLRNAMITVLVIVCYGYSFTLSAQEAIMTVRGPIPAEKMGTTLIHEHVLVDFIGADKTGYHRWDRDSVAERVLPYLKEASEQGVNTLLECTPAYLGRDPLLLKRLSEESGVNILTNTGFYGAVQDKYIPDFAYQISSDSIAAMWIKEFEEGIEGTGIRPGFIKISVDADSVLSAIDEKIVRAAIKTHRATGLTIVSHTGPDDPAFAQIRLLEEAGVSPQAWVWTHAQSGTSVGHLKAGKKGAWISIDNVSKDNINTTIEKIMNLKSAGLLSRLLISQDAGYYEPGVTGGGKFRGYTDLITLLIPALKEREFTQKEIDRLLVENPLKAYRIRVRER